MSRKRRRSASYRAWRRAARPEGTYRAWRTARLVRRTSASFQQWYGPHLLTLIPDGLGLIRSTPFVYP